MNRPIDVVLGIVDGANMFYLIVNSSLPVLKLKSLSLSFFLVPVGWYGIYSRMPVDGESSSSSSSSKGVQK